MISNLERRADTQRANVIEVGILMAQKSGLREATRYFAHHDVELGVVLRVLTGPINQRRAPGQTYV